MQSAYTGKDQLPTKKMIEPISASKSISSPYALIATICLCASAIVATLAVTHLLNIPDPLAMVVLWFACATVAGGHYALVTTDATKMGRIVALMVGLTFLGLFALFIVVPALAWTRLPAEVRTSDMFGLYTLAEQGGIDVLTYLSLCTSVVLLGLLSLALTVGAVLKLLASDFQPSVPRLPKIVT